MWILFSIFDKLGEIKIKKKLNKCKGLLVEMGLLYRGGRIGKMCV